MITSKRLNLLSVAFAVCTAIAAQAVNGTTMMDRAIATFIQSGQLLTKDTHWSHAHEQWHFKLTVEGDTLVEPHALTLLKAAFATSAEHSPFAYLCDKGKGPSQPCELHFQRQDNFYGGIYGRCHIGNDQNIRIVSVEDNGKTVFYGLKWDVVPVIDRNGKQWRTLEGVVFAFKEGIWKVELHQQDMQGQFSMHPLADDNQLKYGTLMAQLHRLNELTGSNRNMQADLYIYTMSKLFADFSGQLTEQQYNDVVRQIYPFSERELTAEQRRLFDRAVANLHQHTRSMPTGSIRQSGLTTGGPFISPEQERLMELHYDLEQLAPSSVNVTISVKASGEVTVVPYFPYSQPLVFMINSGPILLGEAFLRDQLLVISDRQGNRLVIIADSIPTEVNLNDMTVRGSTQNERFAEAQRRLKALEPELRKYACRDADGDYTVIDTAGYRQLSGDVHQLQMQLMDENTDNMIPAWFLASGFTTMSYDDLARHLRHDRPYANHVALQPVWQYYEGLAQRLPGRMFTDAECVDTAGVAHRLNEYIGRGDYVVLQFWEERNWTAHSGCKYMKRIAKAHRGQNLRVVGISLDADKNQWKRYVKKRDLCYEHLAVPDISDDNRWESEPVKAYGIMTLPETIIFAPDGHIINTGLAGESLEEYVNTLPLN
ncbi:MAG: TlpA family protein disulfide reductase [Prevotella sp.]|nr:TlpA family protein disulfide reductase [Prevotella sp.]